MCEAEADKGGEGASVCICMCMQTHQESINHQRIKTDVHLFIILKPTTHLLFSALIPSIIIFIIFSLNQLSCAFEFCLKLRAAKLIIEKKFDLR